MFWTWSSIAVGLGAFWGAIIYVLTGSLPAALAAVAIVGLLTWFLAWRCRTWGGEGEREA